MVSDVGVQGPITPINRVSLAYGRQLNLSS